ncbi:endonuclease/exonuclease/phosphatase family protein [Arthrobacter sp. PAMC25564]|uniref:endonuclease/exonuclease/phosphatase family protein n=1 Tax=Arthrobacter sp. PAMC25564 TaxID=2565366 RepID=UPI001445C404|nr:endonuclease/exonuclease/phosphatase family protein [Arthrobacter sp. PAMC25564]
MQATVPEGRRAVPSRHAGVWRAVLLSLLAVLLALPGAVLTAVRIGPWELGTPWVQLLSGYPLTVPLTLASVLAAVLVGRRRRVRLVVSAGMVLVLAVQLAMLAPRLVPMLAERGAADLAASVMEGPGRLLTVMSLNVGSSDLDAAALLDAVRANHVDILALPELGPVTLERLENAGISGLLPYRVTDVDSANVGNGIFSAFPLTTPGRVPGSQFFQSRAVATVPGIPSGIHLTSVHVNSPRPGHVPRWQNDLNELAALQNGAQANSPTVLLGDFNSSLDHRGLRNLVSTGLSDAASATGRGLWPTWPANSPAPPFVQIDHVLVSRELTVVSFTTVPVPGSDHLAVLSELSYRG